MPALQMDKEISLSIKEVSPTDVFHHRLRDKNARMAELVDAVDSKSTDRNIVPVRVRLRVPSSYFKASEAYEIARVFQNMAKGGRHNGRHFPSQIHLHEAWCFLLLKVCAYITSVLRNLYKP